MPLQHWRAQIKAELRASPARSRANAEGTSRQWTQRSPPLFQMRVGEGCGSMCGRNVVFSVPQSGHLSTLGRNVRRTAVRMVDQATARSRLK